MHFIWTALLTIAIGLPALQGDSYDFDQVIKTELPAELQEVSGITLLDPNTLACIQDEDGVIYLYDLRKQQLIRTIPFAGAGDFEGIARKRNELFVLRSDGFVFEIRNWKRTKPVVDSFQTHIPNINNEGFCYDSLTDRLLIGSKSKVNKEPEMKHVRTIYSLNLQTRQVEYDRTWILHTKEVLAYAKEHRIDLHLKPAKKDTSILKPNLKIKISGLYVHPKTQELYVLSAADHYLMVFNRERKITGLKALNPEVYNKSEGITIAADGTIYISNEGQAGKPTLLKINPGTE